MEFNLYALLSMIYYKHIGFEIELIRKGNHTKVAEWLKVKNKTKNCFILYA